MINLRRLAASMPEAEAIIHPGMYADDFVSLPAFNIFVTADGEVYHESYTASGNGNKETLLITIGEHMHDNLKFVRWVIIRVAVLHDASLMS